jgi:hypothetical protein
MSIRTTAADQPACCSPLVAEPMDPREADELSKLFKALRTRCG